jgi:carotenoid cleavage dioxygenase
MLDQVKTEAARTNLAPIPMECDAPYLKVTGELPRELNGTLYRNGPTRNSMPPARTGSSATACCTPSISRTAAPATATAGSAPRNGWPSTTPAARCSAASAASCRALPPESPTMAGVANTNIIFHGGKLLALEEGHLPTEIEPGHPQSRRLLRLQRRHQGPFTAHPKIDPVTGEMVFFGYNAAGPLTPALSFGSVNAAGVVTRFDRFESPYASMVHDFIVTENHLLFPILPITGSMERAMRGKRPTPGSPRKALCRRHEAQRLGERHRLVPRRELLRLPHHECVGEGNRIIADVMQFEEAPLFTHPDGSKTDPDEVARAASAAGPSTSRQYRPLHANLSRRSCTGRISRASTTAVPDQSDSHGWYACANPDLPMFGALAGIVHVDGNGKRLGQYLLPAGDTISEPVFVERGREAAEGDGWLLSAVWRAQENRSDLAVFNAQDVEAGPVALVHLGHRVPDGFHGNWVGAA